VEFSRLFVTFNELTRLPLILLFSASLFATSPLSTFPKNVTRGGLLYVSLPAKSMQGKKAGDFTAKFNGTEIPPLPCGENFCALMGIGLDDTPDKSELVVSAKDGTLEFKESIPVGTKKVPMNELKVAPRHVDISDADKKRMEDERKETDAVYHDPAPEALWQGKFRLPGKGQTTSPFGSGRRYNGKVASVHYGLDLRGNEKTKVLSSNAGRVVLAKNLFNGGNMVIIDHGLGIFTSYAHLSSFAVKVGDTVKSGQHLGQIGATGRATGPHLHWGVRIHELFVDPAEFLSVVNQTVVNSK